MSWNDGVADAEVKLRPAFGPAAVADSVQSAGPAVPPSSFVTLLTSFSCGPLSLFTIVQVACWPTAIVTAFLSPLSVPPVHDHSPFEVEAVGPPDSDSA